MSNEEEAEAVAAVRSGGEPYGDLERAAAVAMMRD